MYINVYIYTCDIYIYICTSYIYIYIHDIFIYLYNTYVAMWAEQSLTLPSWRFHVDILLFGGSNWTMKSGAHPPSPPAYQSNQQHCFLKYPELSSFWIFLMWLFIINNASFFMVPPFFENSHIFPKRVVRRCIRSWYSQLQEYPPRVAPQTCGPEKPTIHLKWSIPSVLHSQRIFFRGLSPVLGAPNLLNSKSYLRKLG